MHIVHNSRYAIDLVTRPIFDMKAHPINTHLPIPRSSSSSKVKDKNQGNISQKIAVSGALVVHKSLFYGRSLHVRHTAGALKISKI